MTSVISQQSQENIVIRERVSFSRRILQLNLQPYEELSQMVCPICLIGFFRSYFENYTSVSEFLFLFSSCFEKVSVDCALDEKSGVPNREQSISLTIKVRGVDFVMYLEKRNVFNAQSQYPNHLDFQVRFIKIEILEKPIHDSTSCNAIVLGESCQTVIRLSNEYPTLPELVLDYLESIPDVKYEYVFRDDNVVVTSSFMVGKTEVNLKSKFTYLPY